MTVEVRVSVLAREAAGDDGLGRRLVDAVENAVLRGGAPASAIAVGASSVAIVPLWPFARANLPATPLLVGLCRDAPGDVGAVEAVGLIGAFVRREHRDDPGVPVAMVFLEWPDGRWWQWVALMGPQRIPIDEGGVREMMLIRPGTESLRRAIDGEARPSGLGGWWTLSRARPIGLAWARKEPQVH